MCCSAFLTADIYEKVSEELEKGGLLDCECIGGGRIKHDAQAKKIHVYGYSMVNINIQLCEMQLFRHCNQRLMVFSLLQGFGRANHAVTTEKLKARYPDYEVTWDNEGY